MYIEEILKGEGDGKMRGVGEKGIVGKGFRLRLGIFIENEFIVKILIF